MTRWLVVLSFAVTHCAAVAAASSPGSPLRFAEQAGEPQVQQPQVQQPQPPEPQAQQPKSTSAECKGRRVIAASYGRGQRTTSSGERFDPHGMTAAHRTLAFGTRVTVTNLKTGKSVIVVVNDRGPSTKRIEIDISIPAAKAIGLDGTGAVCIE
jgi:rare lipoprotein A